MHINCTQVLDALIYPVHRLWPFNTLRSSQNIHFADDIFNCIFWNENLRILILIPISVKFVGKVPIDNKPAAVKTTVWRPTGVTIPYHYLNQRWPSLINRPHFTCKESCFKQGCSNKITMLGKMIRSNYIYYTQYLYDLCKELWSKETLWADCSIFHGI